MRARSRGASLVGSRWVMRRSGCRKVACPRGAATAAGGDDPAEKKSATDGDRCSGPRVFSLRKGEPPSRDRSRPASPAPVVVGDDFVEAAAIETPRYGMSRAAVGAVPRRKARCGFGPPSFSVFGGRGDGVLAGCALAHVRAVRRRGWAHAEPWSLARSRFGGCARWTRRDPIGELPLTRRFAENGERRSRKRRCAVEGRKDRSGWQMGADLESRSGWQVRRRGERIARIQRMQRIVPRGARASRAQAVML